MSSTLLAGCAGGGGHHDSAPPTLQTMTPEAGGAIDTLRWALPEGEPTSVDPAKVGDYSPAVVATNVCESLAAFDADFNLRPNLAKTITKPDPTTYVFDLHPNVRFSNGDPMTADDVAYSLKRNMDPELGSFWSSYYQSVSSIDVTGPGQVTVRLSRPDFLFEPAMATLGGAVSQRKFVEQAGNRYGTPTGGVMCTGPLTMQSWKPGESITLKRNETYWDHEHAAKAATVDFRIVTEPSTLTTALQAGEFDGAYELPVSTRSALANSATGSVFDGPSTQMVELIPTEKAGPMSNVAVRTALDMAIDKKALAQSVYGGAAEPLKSFLPPFMWGTGPARAIYQQAYDKLPDTTEANIEEAKKLVDSAGLTDRAFTAAVGSGDEAGLRTLTFVQSAAKQIGLDMTIQQVQPTENSEMYYNESARAAVDLLYTKGYSEIASPLAYAAQFAVPGELFNWTGYSDPKVHDLLQQARQTDDPRRSAQLFTEAQALFVPQRLTIPLVSPNESLFLKNSISGAPASFAYIDMPWAAMIGAK
ncbi:MULTISPECIES: ABC transporter substrate-binding protein [unclassified Mycolicibacterium]|uniref:ABC transporter substrate-binding protein n=1 Tax=unclassified Mycolicibacterium TaxID=2636767 RepID=UPI00139147F1|nr:MULTISPECIES: ABC transporter substrate-binding protein [unclassified Mycolicibacterium]